eukprot:TRINITY_DN11520_c0_g1_i1.p1 TRINITY_DN11520_c0_g1~~TRINITY_DN11520_c0_g1_i1.p1  ORF type:complete len:985 (+),score=333.59 TRINITY_DN11520_c0_g1_i1:87-2957(+)
MPAGTGVDLGARLCESPTFDSEQGTPIRVTHSDPAGLLDSPFEKDGAHGAPRGAPAAEPRRKAKKAEWKFGLELDDTQPAQSANGDLPAYRILAVSCRLPLRVRKEVGEDGAAKWAVEEVPNELLPTALHHLERPDRYCLPHYQIGWIDSDVDPEDRAELSSILINDYRCVPIYLERDEVEGFYHGFCKGVLWPLLHYSLNTKHFVTHFKHFPMYEKVNDRFADAVLRVHRKGDVVWINDYHLLLVAKKIRARIAEARVGFFMHSPFPTVELFRQLPVRKELLDGMLAADVIGFNAYTYCTHHREACEALLSLDTEGKGLHTSDGRFVRTHISPAGVNVDLLREYAQSPAIQERVMQRREHSQLRGLKIVVGRSRKLDEACGIFLRLAAFEEFLQSNPDLVGHVVLLEVIEQRVTDKHLQALVQETVGNINGRFGDIGRPTPVHLVQPRDSNEFTMEESAELYMLANVLLVTPLRDGLGLASHEAVVFQADHARADGTVWKGNNAPLILSEFAGACTALGGSIIVNPHDIFSVAKEITRALSMTEEQRHKAHAHNYQYVARNSTAFWAEQCIQEYLKIGAPTAGFSAGAATTKSLREKVRGEYTAAGRRLLLLDWDGTTVSLTTNRAPQMPKAADELLQRLCSDPKNVVYVMSGRPPQELAALFAGYSLGWVAEHGALVKPHTGGAPTPISKFDTSWIPQIAELLENYTDRTPGSVTEKKTMGLTWHWRDSDPDFAAWMEKDLMVSLHSRMGALPFNCFIGKRCVEVVPTAVSKVKALRWLVDNTHLDIRSFDFVLAIGNGKSDEELFEALLDNHDVASDSGLPHLNCSFIRTPPHKPDGESPYLQSLPLAANRSFGSDSKEKVPSALLVKPCKSEREFQLHPDVKNWCIKVGELADKTHATVSVETQNEVPEFLSQITGAKAPTYGHPLPHARSLSSPELMERPFGTPFAARTSV